MNERSAAHADLSSRTSLRVGGPAGRLHLAHGRDALLATVGQLAGAGPDELLVLGGGTNVVVSDHGFAGDVVVVSGGDIHDEAHGEHVELTVDAGVDWDDLVAVTVTLGCTGIEMISGVPGLVGAAPIQNIGAYGQQVCDVITAVEVVDRVSGDITHVGVDDCGFAFRTSRFKTEWLDRYVVSRVHLRLARADVEPPPASTYVDIERWFASTGLDPTDLEHRRRAVLDTRRLKSMLIDPDDPWAHSAGSFFVNPSVPLELAQELAERFDAGKPVVHYLEGRSQLDATRRRVPAALVLRHTGFNAGDSWGPVQLSPKHVLALVTRPGATATDVHAVASHIRARVHERCGVDLDTEVRFVGVFPDYDPEAFGRTYVYRPADGADPEWLARRRS